MSMKRRQVLIAGGALAGAGLAAALTDVALSGMIGGYVAGAQAMRARLTERPQIKDFIRLATLAANGHNTQPWRFHLGTRRIDIRPDFARRTSVVDPDD